MPASKRHRKPRLTLTTSATPTTEFYTFQNMPSRYRASGELSACEIQGDSLAQAGIPHGYMVAILHGGKVNSGDLISAKIYGSDDHIVRFVFFAPGGRIRLQAADRDEYPDLIYHPEQFEIIGPIVHAEPRTPRLTARQED